MIHQKILWTAKQFSLAPEIVFGICKTESNINPVAVRYEPNYKWLHSPKEVKPHNCTIETEIMLQKTSFGVMQMMGSTLRDLKYNKWLTEILVDVDAQLFLGCEFLKQKIDKYKLRPGIAAYNSGTPRYITQDGQKVLINEQYVEKVLHNSKLFPYFIDMEIFFIEET